MVQTPVYEPPTERVAAGPDAVAADEEVFVFPASFAQQRLWFLDQFEPNSPFYNIPSAVRLSGSLHVAALERSLNEIVRRHESLRTTFATLEGQPVQVISPRLKIPMPVKDLSHLPAAEQEAAALRLARREARQPFNLARGPLLRATLLRLGETEHIILLTMHHIVSDGWSIGVLIAELATLYDAFAHDRPSPLPELRLQYADFAAWQQEWLQGEILEEQLDYWKEQLGDGPAVLELPTDRPRPAIQTNQGANLGRKLPKALSEALKTLSRQEGVTLFMTLVAAFQTLLFRYTGQEDVSIGTPIANRTRAEIEGLIGLFINTLVLRTDLSGRPAFRELLRRVREVALGAYAHQDLPFETLVEALQPERDMSHSPLFQVMFILQNAPVTAQALPGLTLSTIDVDSGTATFDLTLSVSEEADGLDISAEYNTDLFDGATIERLLRHFETLLAGIVADPAQSIAALPLLAEGERQQLLVAWNDTAVDFPRGRGRCAHHLFEAQAAQTPDAVAVVLPGGGSLSYGELNRRANQVGHYLQRLGVGPGTLVGVCVERSLEMIAGLLGVLKAGGAYLPLDPAYPPDRLAFMLDDAQVTVLLTQSHLLESLPLDAPRSTPPGHAPRVVSLDSDWDEIAQESAGNPASPVTPGHLAYVIYTSGSTGRSKGVMIAHRCLVNAYLGWEDAYRLRTDARAHLQMANFSFDVFSGDLVRALCSGGRLVLCPREWLLDSERLYAAVRQEEIDCAEFVPAVLRNLIQHLDETGQRLDAMRLLICGSDNWYVGEYRHFLRFCGPETRLINSFGLTEATIDSCFFEGPVADLAADRLVPIGRPLANTQLYILDPNLQPAPVGVPGELYVGGEGLADGYFNRPALTAARFVPHPFSAEPGARLYKTGDLARFLPGGNIEFLGRLDHQLKIRGFRIEPGEIEAALRDHPAVRQTAVLAQTAPSGDERLVAYVEPAREPAPGGGELRRFLQERLPDYMVPSAFVTLAALPLTPSGKLDRRALPPPDWSRRELGREYVAPRTPAEEVLAGVWTQVLGVERVGAQDNFFELGGHSLLATQLVSRVRQAFQVEMPLRHIFESPTLAALAEQVEILQRTAAGALAVAPPIRPAPRDGELPLSFAQQRLWFLDQLEPGSPFYNLPESVRLNGPLNVAALEESLNEVVRRHESLRTTFRTVDGRPVQVIAPELAVPLPVTDLRDRPEAERQAEASRLAQHEAQRPFDLARGPLLRARLLRLDEEDHVILLTMHHIVGDDWSTAVLVQEMAALYDARVTARGLGLEPHGASPLPDLPIQYADFAAWQRAWLQGEVLQAQLDYWRGQLADLPPLLELPTDRPRPPVQTYRGDYLTFALPPALSNAVRDLCQAEGVTLFMALLAAFQALLYRYTGQPDICVGSPIANRNRAEIEGLIGFFVNTLVLRTDLSGEPSFRALLQRVREVALGAYAHQDLPFEMIVDAVQPERDLSHSPLFQVMFVIQNTPRQARELPGLSLSPVEAHSGTAKFDLTLFMIEEGDQLSGALEYNTDLFGGATVARMLQHFERLLAGFVADPERPISSLPLLAEAEQRQLLVEWNDTAADFPRERCAHHLFEAQVERTPEAVAVAFEDETLTYAGLNRRANQLAHFLQKQGVGPETLVGLSVERSPEMVVGILGILKAGGAYLPLDPTYPLDRLAFMLDDAQAPILLTQQRLLHDAPRITHHASRSTPHAPRVVCLDSDWEEIAQESAGNPASPVRPGHLAYVIYTSGSTGAPKGTMVLHRGLVNYLTWCRQAYPVAAGQGAPVHSSISFDLTITGLFSPLLAGGRVRLLPEELGFEVLSAALQDETDFSLVKITPAHLELLSQQLSPAAAAGRTHAFIIGGENLLAEHLAFWQQHAPDTLLVNEYGPTETVVGCCVYQVPPGATLAGSVPIGRPIINTRLYVLDPHGQPVPAGVPGELYIGGVGVARGYLRRPALTAERFIPDPFSAEPGARLYRTGDLARYRPDGNLEFLGRVDDQVKVRGFRVELGEIEAVLGQHPGLREVAVVARDAEAAAPARRDKRLVAYAVPAGATAPSVSELRDFLHEKLPEYMVPASFVTLAELPLTPNGKVDRRALPAPDQARPDLDSAFVPPRTPQEETLARIWTQVLGLEQVGVHDNFFELGGDSILSIQVVARANQAGLRLTPRQIFQQPTISGLAAVAGAGPAVQAEQGLVTGPAPLTPIQRWFFDEQAPGAPGPAPNHWNQALLLDLRQPLDPALLETAVGHLLAHHDALRLRFERGDGGWQQHHAGADEPVPFSRIDLAGLPPAEQGPALEAEAARLQASLDLARGPILRVAYFDLGPDRPGRLLIAVHHLAVDGVSWRILLEDLLTAYEQLHRGEEVQLPPKTTSFQYWAERLAGHAGSGAVQAQLAHWLGPPADRLARLPLDARPPAAGPANSEASARSVTVTLGADETQALLQAAPAAYRTEINEVLLAALAQAFAGRTEAGTLLVDLEGHGREDLFEEVDLSRTVGWFTTIFPVRLGLDAVRGAGPGEALKAIKEQVRQALGPDRGLGYGLLRYLSPEPEAGRQLKALPAAEVSFNYLGQVDQALPAQEDAPFGPAPESRGPDRSPRARRAHLLEIDGGIAGGQLQLEWTYSRDLHRRETIEGLAQDFLAALRAIIAHCQSPEAGGYTPSDFTDFGWDQDDLEDILAEIGKSAGQE